MKHIVLTRINFEDDKLFNDYFEVMKNTYIPSIKSQKNKNFKIGFIINQKHIKFLKKYFEDDTLYFTSTSECKEYCISNSFQLQTRHDCDDWMSEDYIETIQRIYTENISKKDIFLINSKVQKLNYLNGDLYSRGDIEYTINNKNISMFLTLCQKNVQYFVYEKEHSKMNSLTNNIFLLDEGYTRLVIHNKNILSKIHYKDKLIKNINNHDISVIIPTYDNIEYIEECLNSVLESGKNKNIEILVGIDNCQKTKNYVINNINKFKKFIRFYFFDKNVGPYVIRNSLANISSSKNLLFFDSDDIVRENLIPIVLKNLETHDVVRYKFFNFKKNEEIPNLTNKDIGGFFSVGQLGIKKEIFLSLNGFEPWSCAADSEFQSREIGNKFNTIYLDKVLFYRRRHDKNITILPKTNAKSNIRQNYHRIIEERKRSKNFGGLVELPVSKFFKMGDNLNFNLVNDYDNLNLFVDNNYRLTTPIIKKNNEIISDRLKLSIIIPTFSNVSFLPECFESILKSIKDLDCEILVGIDGCNETLNYLKNKQFDKRFKFYFFEKNIGPYVIKNTLVTKSSSNNILFFDSDDIMLEDMVPEALHVLSSNKFYKPMYVDFTNKNDVKVTSLTKSNKYGEGVFAIDRETFLSFNGFEGWRCAADSDLMGRLYSKNISFSFGKMVSFLRRIHPDSLTVKPETNYSSKMRAHYYGLSKKNRPNGVCDVLSTSECKPVTISYIKDSVQEKFEERKKNVDIVLGNILNLKNKKPETIVDYVKINEIISKKGAYNVNSSIKPVRQNTPKDRNELMNLKKGNVTEQMNKMFPGKSNRRGDSPNIFSNTKKNR